MQTTKMLVNQNRFMQAIAYTNQNYFSKPFSISPIFKRWFNQLAIAQLASGELIHLSGTIAIKYVNILVDNISITQEQIKFLHKYYDQADRKNLLHEKLAELRLQKISLKHNISEIDETMPGSAAAIQELKKQLESLKQAKIPLTEELEAIVTNRSAAEELYKSIVQRGTLEINIPAIEDAHQSKVTAIMHRPNHGLMHSVRAAYSVPAIQQCNHLSEIVFDQQQLERLQLMMLFSVVGRQDETGFNDTGRHATTAGNQTYAEYRIASARAYVKYCLENKDLLSGLYSIQDDFIREIYHDALIIQLMGYRSVEGAIINSNKIPDLFIDYLQKTNQCSRDEAINLFTTYKQSGIECLLKVLFDHEDKPSATSCKFAQ
ncbi:MAG: hypothetical protein A3E88_01250 [Legionellales bacterium RIFCSPHIGHO2_12_FULL_35_11]|nr:MAG: hypothetical protein A3E88_01250 [Legionellales bacterium RIFCSPHIGHO2_12_FULL_35_11]